ADGQPRDVRNGFVFKSYGERDRLQSLAVTFGARHLAHVALELLPAVFALDLAVPSFDERDHALVGRVVRTLAVVTVLVADVYLFVVAIEHGPTHLQGQAVPRRRRTEAHRVGERIEQPCEVVGTVATGPRCDHAVSDRQAAISDDQVWIDLESGAETGAFGARTEGRVERERARLKLFERQVVVGACKMLGKHPLAMRIVFGQVDEFQGEQTARELERGLNRVGQPALRGLLHREPVDDHLDRVLLLLLQLRRLGQRIHHTVDAHPRESLGLQVGKEVGVLALATTNQRREYLEPGALVEFENPVDDLLRGLPGDGPTTNRAVRMPDAGVQQPQVVVDLGDGADRRSWVAVRRLLVDGDGRRETLDEIDVRFVHLAEELPGVGRQRLDVAPLAFGENRVEGEARLPRARKPGKDDQGVARQVERDVLEVVLARAADHQTIDHDAAAPSPQIGGLELVARARSPRCTPGSSIVGAGSDRNSGAQNGSG